MTLSSVFRRSLLLAFAIGIPTVAPGQTAAPPNATVYIINLKDGDTVTSPFKVQFGLTGMGIAPAGVERPNTGHHHLLVDTTLSPDELKQPIAMDAKHLHFGGGQTETMLTLPPGRHTLQLGLDSVQSADHVTGHHPYGEVTRGFLRAVAQGSLYAPRIAHSVSPV
jgi:uncharacterized protein DUF4399